MGSPQEVIEKTLGFREYVGDYQRRLFLMDHAGLPQKTVLEQLDLLGLGGGAGAAQGVRPAPARTCRTPRTTPACRRGRRCADSGVHAADDVTGRTAEDAR